MQNTDYWKNEGSQKSFSHPVVDDWLNGLDKHAAILDFGCGYGRLTPILKKLGFTNIIGYDPSIPLIERAIQENPGATYTHDRASLCGKYFDLILCFALFTSCPLDSEQKELTEIINALSRDQSLLYISDYETLDNPHYNQRYEQRHSDIYGCFTSGQAVFRHHQQGHFETLLPGWEKTLETTFAGKTLHGNPITIHQYLLEKVCNRS